MTEQAKDCPCCCETYNNSNHTEITCPRVDCAFSTCKSCIRMYLLGTVKDPHCMNCKTAWDQDFIVFNLNRSFVIKDYKAHRQETLLDREMSKMPETMEKASRFKKKEKLEEKK